MLKRKSTSADQGHLILYDLPRLIGAGGGWGFVF